MDKETSTLLTLLDTCNYMHVTQQIVTLAEKNFVIDRHNHPIDMTSIGEFRVLSLTTEGRKTAKLLKDFKEL